MANEVINESEESNETSALTETNTENSGVTAADENNTDQESSASSEEKQNSAEMDFGAILEEFEQDQTTYQPGDLVEGKVVGVSERGILVDFGFKSEGIIPAEEFTTPEGDVTVQKGDLVEAVIRSIYSGDSPPILSRNDALNRKAWDDIEKSFNDETPIIGRVVEKTKGGLKVDINGVEAFLPGSQVDSRPIRNLDSFKNQEIEAKIIKFSRKRNNIVLSRKVLTDEKINAQKFATLENIEEGYIIEGTIRNLTEYGAFVDIGGIDGLLHVTDMSWGRLQNPNELFKVNDRVQVKVLKLDRAKEKISLGYKQLIPDPWSTVIEVYPVGSKVTGKISSLTDYGAFIELEAGVEGLVHVSEMSWSKRSKSPKKLLNNGDDVEVQVLGVDTDERRISLGMKQLQKNPWQTITERYQIGSTVKGKVRNLTDFGAFIEVEEGVDGLVHISDISHTKKIKHPKDVLKKDQEVEAVITSIDPEGRRMSLSIKDTTPSEWDAWVATHKSGDVVRGKVSRFADFGVFVELGEGLEGLCHISELSDERVEKPEDVVTLGQELDFKILRIERDDQKIGLSHRAVGKVFEPPIDTKSYSSGAKSGMASLGELMNLKRGVTAEEEVKEEPRLSKKERKALKLKERSEQQADDSAETASENPETVSGNEDVTETSPETAETTTETTTDQEIAETATETTTDQETVEPVAETASDSETSSETADNSTETEEKIESTEESGDAVNAEKEQNAAADSVDETPVINDVEGEASLAADNSAPQDNVSEEALSEADSDNSVKAEESEASNSQTESTEESEEKTANG